MLLLGYDIGSSAVKAALYDSESGEVVGPVRSPAEEELKIDAPHPGWAEQAPALWWEHVKEATSQLAQISSRDLADVSAIGLAYQMHGLVLVDENREVIRPSIIWCDSRAVETGEEAFRSIGSEWCMKHLLNSPGNFTASKLAWVKENEPDKYERVHKAMLPGDYIALRMTGNALTSYTGLSEGTMWDVEQQGIAVELLDYFGISPDLLPEAVPTFGDQGSITTSAAEALGLKPGIPVTYRAGDQPNNAFSLGVTEPGQAATTAGTSGVVYSVSDEALFDEHSRVNSFLHVNHTPETPRYGTLMCVNGTGILNRWVREQVAGTEVPYDTMNKRAAKSPVGANGLAFLPYGNGAERTLGNLDLGASIHGLRLNEHSQGDVIRAAQEGIVFALCYGCDIMKEMGMEVASMRAAHGNMFLSPLFSEAFATVMNAEIELVDTDGAQGAALGAGVGAGYLEASHNGRKRVDVIEPNRKLSSAYTDAYRRWLTTLDHQLATVGK